MASKTNYKECGPPTYMDFSMKVYQDTVDSSACPYISNDFRSREGIFDEM